LLFDSLFSPSDGFSELGFSLGVSLEGFSEGDSFDDRFSFDGFSLEGFSEGLSEEGLSFDGFSELDVFSSDEGELLPSLGDSSLEG